MSYDRESFVPNPVLAGLIGVCPLAVAAKSLAEGAAYGLGAAICAIILALILPPLRGFLPDRLQAPASLALSAALAALYALCLRAYSPSLADALWIYLPLLAASGLSLIAIKQSAQPSRLGPDGQSRVVVVAFQSLMYFLTASLVGALREALGVGVLTLPTPGASLLRVSFSASSPARILVSPAGGFIVLGILVALYRATLRASGRKGM